MSKALGKGLSALIPEKSSVAPGETVSFIKVASIKDSSLQPRTNYNDERLKELKASIKDKGVLQPILVRKKGSGYEVVAGERRLKAVRDLKVSEIPAIIKDVTDQEALVLALVENIQREELNPVEEAQGFKRLIDEFGYTQDTVAQSVGKDRSTVSNLLRILKLPKNILNSIADGNISVGHARTLLGVDTTNDRTQLFEETIRKKLSVRELENLVKSLMKRGGRKERAKVSKNPQVVALEENMQKYFGTKVRIEGKNKRGKIVIDYYSTEDLERIIRLMIKK